MTAGPAGERSAEAALVDKRHPSRYVQGAGVLAEIVPLLSNRSTFVVCGKRGWQAVRDELTRIGAPGEEWPEPFHVRQASQAELDRAVELCVKRGCASVLAMGGGRAIDLGKACASESGLPCTVVPTLLGADAACSSVSVLYDDRDSFLRYLDQRRNPAAVIVDLDLLRAGPGRYFAAGAVGALAVFFEAEERIESGGLSAPRIVREHYLEEAKSSRRRLMEVPPKGLRAPARLGQGDLEDSVFLSLWTSADLFENVGLSLAHGIYRGLRGIGLSGPDGYLHGELVGLGLLCQLHLCDTHRDELKPVSGFVGRALSGTDWPALRRAVRAERDLYGERLASFAAGEHTRARPDPREIVEATLEAVGSL